MTNVLAALVAQVFLAITLIVPVVKLLAKLTAMALVVCPLVIAAFSGAVHL